MVMINQKEPIELTSPTTKTTWMQPSFVNSCFKTKIEGDVGQIRSGKCSCPVPCEEGGCCYNFLSSRPLKWCCSLFFAF
jgi:hypothetical protein